MTHKAQGSTPSRPLAPDDLWWTDYKSEFHARRQAPLLSAPISDFDATSVD